MTAPAPQFREAREADIPRIVALLADDALGQAREGEEIGPYLAAFRQMRDEGGNTLVVAEEAGRIVGTFQLTIISGLSRRAARRAQVESVRVAREARGRGLGEALMQEAERRARAAGCTLLQLTSDASRQDAHRFYERLGFTASHIGYKRVLD